jgi:hypothetical protein
MSALFWFGVTTAIGALMIWAQDRFPEIQIEEEREDLERDIEECGMHLRERIAAIRERQA